MAQSPLTAGAHISVLAREAEHRTTNILATVQATVHLAKSRNCGVLGGLKEREWPPLLIRRLLSACRIGWGGFLAESASSVVKPMTATG